MKPAKAVANFARMSVAAAEDDDGGLYDWQRFN
jgi:hypothetical protein